MKKLIQIYLKESFRKISILVNIALIILLAVPANAQDYMLFEDYSGGLDSKQSSVVANLTAMETTKRSRIVKIDPGAFDQQEITVNFFDDHSPVLQYQDIGHTGVKMRTWTGNFPEDLGSGSFVINGNRISGHVVSLLGNYEIYPLGNEGVHIVVEHDGSGFKACGTDALISPRTRNGKKDDIEQDNDMGLPGGQKPSGQRLVAGNECFVRIIVGYTSLAQTNTSADFSRTMIEHVSLGVTESNQGYANSDMDMRMELAYMYEVADNETTNACNDVDDLQATSDGQWDDIHDVRNFYDGDMVCLITGGLYAANPDCNPNGGLCGIAFAFDYTDDTNMFQLTEYDCVTESFSFAHEFGHTQGARHDNDNTGTPFSYARGYNQGTFRTIMAVCCTPDRVNYWSNPDIDFPDCACAMGTATRDNSRALDVSDYTVAHHRTTPGTYTTGLTLADDTWLNMLASTVLSSSNDANSGALLELKSFTTVKLIPGFHAFTGSTGRYYIAPTCPGTSYSLTESEGEISEAKSERGADGYLPVEEGRSRGSRAPGDLSNPAADGQSAAQGDMPVRSQVAASQSADGAPEAKAGKVKKD
jgi:peptidyl-Asp metalloendopeptidase